MSKINEAANFNFYTGQIPNNCDKFVFANNTASLENVHTTTSGWAASTNNNKIYRVTDASTLTNVKCDQQSLSTFGFKYRLNVKAGLTGYAQIYGKYNTTLRDKLFNK